MSLQLSPELLTRMLGELVAEHRVPGAQLAIRWRGRTFAVEAGEEVAGSGRPVTGRSVFPLGSLTKPVTATLAMMLLAEAEVDVDAPVAAELPVAWSGELAKVTTAQVLSHTAGLAASVEQLPFGATRRRWLAKGAGGLLVHAPGTVFSYSNPGYLLLACLVEESTGMSWWDAVESILLAPLGIGMVPVAAGGRGGGDRSLVQGHVVRPAASPIPMAEQSVPELEEPIAGLAASALDLLRFAAAHLPGTDGRPDVIPGAVAEAMRRDQLRGLAVDAYGLADGWGLGWSIYHESKTAWIGHDGTGDGAWCHLRAEPATGTIVALTTNGSTGQWLWEGLVGRLRPAGLAVGHHPLPKVTADAQLLAEPATVAGHYANGAWTCDVVADRQRLRLAMGAEAPADLTVLADLRFTTTPGPGAAPVSGRFVRDPMTGEVALVQVVGRLLHRSSGR